MAKRAKAPTRNQLNVLLSDAGDETIRKLLDAKIKALGGIKISMSAYVESLVMEEAKRQGIVVPTKKGDT